LVCRGGACAGGGVKACAQREQQPSHLAAVLDPYGGLRFIVTHKRELKHHVRPYETLIVVPGVLVHQPLAWGDIPGAIARIEHEVERWIERRGEPNDPDQREAIAMYRLRKLENPRRSLDLTGIVET
jgi:hypothetical protein